MYVIPISRNVTPRTDWMWLGAVPFGSRTDPVVLGIHTFAPAWSLLFFRNFSGPSASTLFGGTADRRSGRVHTIRHVVEQRDFTFPAVRLL